MRSLSDIYKKRDVVETKDFVAIPDIVFPKPSPPPAEEAIEMGDEAGDAADSDGGDAVDIVTVQPSVLVEKVEPPLTREEIERLNQTELDNIRQEAAEQAYSDAIRQKRGELKECIAEVEQQLNKMQEQHVRFVEQYTRELKFLAIDIAEKVISQKIEEDDMILRTLVVQTVSSVKNADWLTVELSERLLSLIDFMKQELSRPEYPSRSEVVPMACPDDTCRVNTEDGTVVSTVSVQMDNLREAFRDAE